MRFFILVFAICYLKVAQARPGVHGGGGGQLQGIPDIASYGKLSYPKFDIIELGEYSKGELPPKEIHSTKHITIKIPQPYPVKVPHSVPVPFPVAKPYPVYQTKIVKVPHPVPYEIVKKIPVPVEVPKPYPVPAEEHHGGGGGGGGSGGGDYGHSFGGGDYGHQGASESFGESYGGGDNSHQQLAATYGVPGQEHGTPLGEHNYSGGNDVQISSYEANGYQSDASYGGGEGGGDESGEEGHDADQSAGYAAVAQPQQYGWQPLQGINKSDNGEQQQGTEEGKQ